MAKKEDLLKGLTPLSAAKKVYKKLSAQTGKSSVKFELQETTKDSKKKVYGPYKGSFVKDKIKVKMAGGGVMVILMMLIIIVLMVLIVLIVLIIMNTI
jgi:hypothetical protein